VCAPRKRALVLTYTLKKLRGTPGTLNVTA